MMKLPGQDKIIVGYDLCDDYAQISFCNVGSDNVETVSSVAGAEVYSIPAVLCKREGVNQWFYGKEALRYAEENNGILIRNLLSLAIDGETVQVEGQSFQPIALLTLFVKRSLGLLSQTASTDKIASLAITSEHLDGRTIEVLNQVFANLRLKADTIYVQNHTESFYYYMIRQPAELWFYKTLLCEYRDKKIRFYTMESNKHTTPIVVYIDEREYPFLPYEPMPETESLRKDKLARMDAEFQEMLEKVLPNQLISSVYLIGEHFTEEWMKESLKYLCRGRRVFQGNNLYSKGACYCMLERMEASESGKSHVFLGNDKLKSNVGMKVLRRGEESYYALLDAGINWYEAANTLEFYLQEGDYLELMVTSLIGGQKRLVQIPLHGLPEGISRLRMQLYLSDEKTLVAQVRDLGFGVFRPAGRLVWKEEVEL